MSDRLAALDARTDLDLRELLGGESPPDLTDAIVSRAAAVARVHEPKPEPPRRGRLAVALLIVLGCAALIATAVWQRSREPELPIQDPEPERGDVLRIADPADLTSAPADTRRLEIDWLTDEEAPWLARFAELRWLAVRRGSGASNKALTDAGLSVLASLTKLEELRLERCPEVHGEFLDDLERLPLLGSLRLAHVALSPEGARRLGALANLRSLDLDRCNLGELEFGALAESPEMRLEHLRVALRAVPQPRRGARCSALVEMLGHLDLGRLRHLVLDQVGFDEDLFDLVGGLDLERLDVVGNKEGMNFARRHLERHPDCHVRFRDAQRRATLAAPSPESSASPWVEQSRARYFVQDGRNLAVIPEDAQELYVCWLCDRDVALLRRFAALRSLVLHVGQAAPNDDRGSDAAALTDRVFDVLADATYLEELAISGCDSIQGRGVDRLAMLPRFSKLSVRGNAGLSSEGWRAVGALPQLESLEAHGDSVDLEALTGAPCLGLRALKFWSLDRYPARDVEALLLRPGFSELSVLETSNFPSFLADILARRPLEKLIVAHPQPEDRNAVAKFSRLRPECEIVMPPEAK